jgi:hypothetical protein
MLESNVSVGDTCKEIGVTCHDSDDAVTEQKHNAEFLTVNRNFELSPRHIGCSTVGVDAGPGHDHRHEGEGGRLG